MKHSIKIQNPLHCAMCVRYNGESVGEVEVGETLKLDWQPSSGWGLQEAHYTDDQDQAVQIDLSTREFTMPDYDIVIEGTAKRFTVQDWTSGTDAADNAGKVLGFDNKGQLVPVDAGSGGIDPQDWNGQEAVALLIDGQGNIYKFPNIGYVMIDGWLKVIAPEGKDLALGCGNNEEILTLFSDGHSSFTGAVYFRTAPILTSPNLTNYRLKVADDGTLSTEVVQ